MKKILLLLCLLPTLTIAEPFNKPYHPGSSCYRMDVPHGWLIFCTAYNGEQIIYMPDEKHEWKL